jgi:AbiV family abortive infection protein
MTEQQRKWAESEYGRTFTRELLKNKEFMGSLLQRVLDSEDGSLMARAQMKELNSLKQRCMYVDVDAHSKVLADPVDISQETAECFLRLARRFIDKGDSQDGN